MAELVSQPDRVSLVEQQQKLIAVLCRRYHIDEIPSPADFRPDYQFWVRDSCERCMQGVLFCLNPEIAAIMDKTPLAVRQIASRGRLTVQRFILNDCAFAHADTCCRCGMDQAIRAVHLPQEFERLRLLAKRINTWKLADQFLPPQDYWLRYAPDYAKSLSQNPSKKH